MTQKEQRMVQLSAQIREKPDWERKFRDPAILKKWREESGVRIDDDMFKFVIDELAYYESLQSGAIKVCSSLSLLFLSYYAHTNLLIALDYRWGVASRWRSPRIPARGPPARSVQIRKCSQ